ncbi:MAG: amino acid permease [Thermaerobacter sp.]|nr:amino acid permease [Thermaerobacter sp.]
MLGRTSPRRILEHKAMSPYTAFVYNVLTMGLIFPWIFLVGPGAFPKASLVMGILLGFALQLPLSLAYTWLGTVIAESGGDWAFQSRIIGRGFGFTVVLSGFVIWVMQWLALSGWMIAMLGFSPLFLGLGVALHAKVLVQLGLAVQRPLPVVILSILFSGLATLLLIAGFHHYVKLQHAIFYLTLVAVALVILTFLIATPQSFRVRFDQFSVLVTGARQAAGTVLPAARALGWTPTLPGGWSWAWAMAPMTWINLQWSTYSVEQGGEIAGQRHFWRHLAITVGALAFTTLLLVLLAVAETRGLGRSFLSAYSFLYDRDQSLAIRPLPDLLAIAFLRNPWLIALITLGYIANSFQIFANCYIGMTRIVSAMVSDGYLPGWLGRSHPRLGTQVNIHVLYFLLGVLWIFAYNLDPHWIHYTFEVTLANGYVFVASGGLAAVLLPYRHTTQYLASPVPHTVIGGIPLITLIGLTGTATGGFMILSLTLDPRYGAASSMPFLLLLGILLFSLVWYMLERTFRTVSATTGKSAR